MTTYIMVINNDLRLDNGEEDTLESVESEVHDLLRSGYFELESIRELKD